MEKKNRMQSTFVVWLGALICCALWGSAFPCIKIGYQMFEIPQDAVVTQILFAGLRFTLAGILVILIGSVLSGNLLKINRQNAPKILKLSLLQTVLQYLFFYIGLANTTGVKASIIEGVNVFIAIFVASLIFRQEKLTMGKLAGCLIGFAGVVLVNLNGNGLDMSFHLNGEGFIFLSTVAYAFSSVYLKRYSKTENPVLLSGWQFISGGLVMTIMGLLMGGKITKVTATGIAMLFYLACISAVAYSLWGILLKYNPVSRVAVFGFMNPVFGVILSAFLLGEREQASGIKSIIALILVSIGIYITAKVKEEKVEETK
ncbi:DMT family transporter [Roseburia sp. BX1005]|uniref:DMT family transporter n=1 Tax=Roseburia zhanii TaxID=2763064 RepID=A0A923LRE8_9FIRM|nr:DMT family transporter [Roseburia zhanii]MBC5714960.1 DMT family transporter [Roseburia zhanii]